MPDSAIQEIVCCIGYPVAGNPTQFMMQRALSDIGLDWCYLTVEVVPENLPAAMEGIRALGFRGANLCVPHKTAAVSLVDTLSESAQLMGAVNCVHYDGHQLIGENTDGEGFVQALGDTCELADRRVLLLGAGGTARAIAVQLGQAGAGDIRVANRTTERAEALVELLRERVSVAAQVVPWDDPLEVADDVDILINATTIGHMDPDAEIPIRLDTLKSSLTVADVVVNPPQTWLLRQAEERGCTTLGGLGMLVNQAALNFKIWTGRDPDRSVMREAVEEFLEI